MPRATLDEESWPFSMWSGILHPKHRVIDPALPVFMTFVDWTTAQDEREPNGERLGWVKGGKPISYREIAEARGLSKSAVHRQIQMLLGRNTANRVYVFQVAVPGGFAYKVRKSKKLWYRTKNASLSPGRKRRKEHGG